MTNITTAGSANGSPGGDVFEARTTGDGACRDLITAESTGDKRLMDFETFSSMKASSQRRTPVSINASICRPAPRPPFARP
jgi:hypothetical protein